MIDDIITDDIKWCQYNRPWYGPCGRHKTDGTQGVVKITHGTRDYWICSRHSVSVCHKCGKPATSGCDFPGEFVCGISKCPDHPHKHKLTKKKDDA